MAFAIKRPIEQHQQEAIEEINKLASDRILSRYPVYKQLNNSRTNEAITMWPWIDNIRDLAKVAKNAVMVANNITAIKTAVSNLASCLQSIV